MHYESLRHLKDWVCSPSREFRPIIHSSDRAREPDTSSHAHGWQAPETAAEVVKCEAFRHGICYLTRLTGKVVNPRSCLGVWYGFRGPGQRRLSGENSRGCFQPMSANIDWISWVHPFSHFIECWWILNG